MPKSARPRAAPPPQSQQPLTDRLGLPGKPTGPYPRYSQAEKFGRTTNQSNAASSSSESVAGLLARMNGISSQLGASTSQPKATSAPSRAQLALADRIDGVAITASATNKSSDATTSGQTSEGDSRWSGKGWQPATPVGGKPGSSKQAPANGSAAPANGSSRKAQAQAPRSPASAASRPAPRLTDRISSPAVRPSSPAATAPSRSRSSTPARQSSNSARTSTSARASPAAGAQPSLLSRLGHQANSPRHGPHVDRSRQSSTSSDMSLSSSDRIAASSPAAPLTRFQPSVSDNSHGDDSRRSPTLSTTTTAPRAQHDTSSFSMSVLGSAPQGSNMSSQSSRPAYMEKPAFDPSNRPGPQSIRGTGAAQADRTLPSSSSQAPRPSGASAPVAQADPATRFAPVTVPRVPSPPASSLAQTTGRSNDVHPADRDVRAVPPPIAPRAMLENAPTRRRSDDSTAALPPSSSRSHAPPAATTATATDAADSTRSAQSAAADQRPQPAQAGPSGPAESESEAGTPPLEGPPPSAPTTAAEQQSAQPASERVGREAEAGTPPPQNHTTGSGTIAAVPTANADSSQTKASTQRVKREAKTPELDGDRANGAGQPPAARSAAAQDADDAAAWAETAARYEAAKREIALLRRQEAALEALRRERAASAKAREEAPRGDQAEQQARRANLLRDKMEREKAEGEAAERVRKAEVNEDGHRTVNAANVDFALVGGRGPVATSSARFEEQQTESATNGAAPEVVTSTVGATSGIVAANQSNATCRKRTASPTATAPSAKHARMEALGAGFAGDDSESEGTSGHPQLLRPPSRAEVKILLPDDDLGPAAGQARSLAGRTGRFARRTPSGSPFSTRNAAAAFEPSLSAFLASFDLLLVPLAGPLLAAGFASVVDLARFASFEPDTRIAVLDAFERRTATASCSTWTPSTDWRTHVPPQKPQSG